MNASALLPNETIMGDRIIIRKLLVSDITQRYVDWLNDPEVNRFLSVRDKPQSMKTVKEYVASYDGDKKRMLLGIFDKVNEKHIGNITFSSIDRRNKTGVIGIAIGDKEYWGKGFATEALLSTIEYVFSVLGLCKLEAGVNEKNIASCKLFEKAGFVRVGTKPKMESVDHELCDVFLYGISKKRSRAKK